MSNTTLSAVDAQLRVGFKLDGRTALVTGGSRGIGAAISRSLASQAPPLPPATRPIASGPRSSSRR